MPAGLGGEVGGAMAMMTLLIPVVGATIAAATAGVVALIICVQFCPPSVDWKPPEPTRPAYKVREPTGEVKSNTRERVSPNIPLPCVQLCPLSVEKKAPFCDVRNRCRLSAGSTIITLMTVP